MTKQFRMLVKERLHQVFLYKPRISDLFNAKYLASEIDSKFTFGHDKATIFEILFFLGSWRAGIHRRKPLPGFNPDVYRRHQGLKVNIDPTIHYLKSGRPDGPWNTTIIGHGQSKALAIEGYPKTALHVHVFYPDLLEDMLLRLSHNKSRPKIFLTHPQIVSIERVQSILERYNMEARVITLDENKGRDIGPFFSELPPEFFTDFDVVGHIHTKKSAEIQNGSVGASWYNFAMINMIGEPEGVKMFDEILHAFRLDEKLGIVFPDDPNLMGWGENYEHARKLLPNELLPNEEDVFEFPVGSFFVARPAALKKLVELSLTSVDWPEEPVPYDGSTLHALERLIGIVPKLDGFSKSFAHQKGSTR